MAKVEKGWKSKTVNETTGPDEGTLRITVEYEDTTRKMAEKVQGGLVKLGSDLLNKKV